MVIRDFYCDILEMVETMNRMVGFNPSIVLSHDAQAQQEQAAQQEEARQQVLSQVLSGEAKERLSRIRLVKPDKVRQVEDVVINIARQQHIVISDSQLCEILEKVSEGEKSVKIQIARRGKKNRENDWDDDDEGW
jgi:programmed cell death protein 5